MWFYIHTEVHTNHCNAGQNLCPLTEKNEFRLLQFWRRRQTIPPHQKLFFTKLVPKMKQKTNPRSCLCSNRAISPEKSATISFPKAQHSAVRTNRVPNGKPQSADGPLTWNAKSANRILQHPGRKVNVANRIGHGFVDSVPSRLQRARPSPHSSVHSIPLTKWILSHFNTHHSKRY